MRRAIAESNKSGLISRFLFLIFMPSTIHTPQPATLEQAQKLGLREEEFNEIKAVLGRVPNFNEVAMYSVMWSEHCSYKNSITWLKTLPRDGARLLVKAGEENAGLVDIGDGWGCVFKIESHNHPSAIEPFQGAATGVGGIHRDIFTMGARPIAALNSLRFGLPDNPKTKWLVKGVVKGIGHYGNCFGVPTVAGEAYISRDCYQTNPLVNAMSVGVVRKVGQTVSRHLLWRGQSGFYCWRELPVRTALAAPRFASCRYRRRTAPSSLPSCAGGRSV